MRRVLSLIHTGAVEALAEPLSPILFLTGLMAVHLLPAFHYHQFGEPGRLARECGFSSLLIFGLLFATSAAYRAIGRELSSGTAAMALTRSVPRPLFFAGKIVGVLVAFLLFLFATVTATFLSSASSTIGANIAHNTGSTPVWGPGLGCGVGFTLFAFIFAAMANRFWRVRFCAGACLFLTIVQPIALGTAILIGNGILQFNYSILTAFGTLAFGCAAFIVMSGALAVRLRPAPVTAIVGITVLVSFLLSFLSSKYQVAGLLRAFVPDISCFWLVDNLAHNGTISWSTALRSVVAGLSLTCLWFVVGSILFERREIS